MKLLIWKISRLWLMKTTLIIRCYMTIWNRKVFRLPRVLSIGGLMTFMEARPLSSLWCQSLCGNLSSHSLVSLIKRPK
jgi:hypothetical protein